MLPGYSLGKRKLSGGDLGCKRTFRGVGGEGLRKQEALTGFTAKFKQRSPLFLILDTFGNHRHVEASGQIEDGFDDRAALVVNIEALYEGAVDFKRIEV
jgi:hypothetical protein